MDSPLPRSFKALVIYRNFMYPELIRTVHVYQLEEGVEEEMEREYVFHRDSAYEETGVSRVLTLETFELSAQYEGCMNGVWRCIYVFNAALHLLPNSDNIPSILSISRNPKLASIPTLANDLQMISQLCCRTENIESSQVTPEETSDVSSFSGFHLRGTQHMFPLDLNLPYPESENEESDQSASGIGGKKKKRAATEDVARLALEDLAKYFDLPIIEASKHLKVGLTVLKKKCREFGIPRWPHRKIKSLDSLIHDLREEVERQQLEDKAAAMMVAKRQRMLESEKESIERKPFMEIQMETKKFRQDIFKRRHRARVRESQTHTMSPL